MICIYWSSRPESSICRGKGPWCSYRYGGNGNRKIPLLLQSMKILLRRCSELSSSFVVGYFHLHSICSSALWASGRKVKRHRKISSSKICSLKATGEASKLPSQPSVWSLLLKRRQRLTLSTQPWAHHVSFSRVCTTFVFYTASGLWPDCIFFSPYQTLQVWTVP